MGKILTIDETKKVAEKLERQNKHIVLAGGCFDILHVGHISFLQKAKEQGGVLFVILESDEFLQKTKGALRPINTQNDRAKVLSALETVDFIILLPSVFSDEDYDKLVMAIKPAIIATTEGDPGSIHKHRQAGLTDAKVISVVERIPDQSSSKLAHILAEKNVL